MKQLVTLIGILVLSSCSPEQYGRSAGYRIVGPERIRVHIPANAPGIFAQFGAAEGDTPDHNGLDVLAHVGTPVIAPAAGRVTRVFYDPTFGHQIHVDHGPDEHGRRVVTRYAHLSGTVVKAGDAVSRGQHMAGLGRSGVASAGFPHLHFEVRRGNGSDRRPVDPHLMWANGVGHVTCYTPKVRIPKGRLRFTYPVVCR